MNANVKFLLLHWANYKREREKGGGGRVCGSVLEREREREGRNQ